MYYAFLSLLYSRIQVKILNNNYRLKQSRPPNYSVCFTIYKPSHSSSPVRQAIVALFCGKGKGGTMRLICPILHRWDVAAPRSPPSALLCYRASAETLRLLIVCTFLSNPFLKNNFFGNHPLFQEQIHENRNIV